MSIFSIRTQAPAPGSSFRPRQTAPARPRQTAPARPRQAAPARPQPAQFRPAAPAGVRAPADARPDAVAATAAAKRRKRLVHLRDFVVYLLFGVVAVTGALAMIAVTSYHFIQPILSVLDGN